MSLQLKEIAISKSCSVKLDNDTIAIIAHVYHTADRKTNPDDQSWYKYAGKVIKIADLEAEIRDKKSMDHRLEKWVWKSPAWADDMFFGYDDGNTKGKEARWLAMKLKKALKWEAYLKLVKDGIKKIAATGKEKRYPGANYEIKDYVDAEGKLHDITNKDDLLKLEGKEFWKDCPLKRSKA